MEKGHFQTGEPDDKWAFIPPSHRSDQRFLCLFKDEKAEYILLVKGYSLKGYFPEGFKGEPEFFHGALYKMPGKEILIKEKAEGLLKLLTSNGLKNPPFILEKIFDARNVQAEYVSSLDEYIENL